MQTLNAGYRSMTVLLSINWDRLLYIFTIALALYAGAVIGTALN